MGVFLSVFMCQCPPPLQCVLRVILHCTSFLVHSLYLIGLVQSTSFSLSVMVSSLIEFNSDNDFGSTLEAFAVMDMLA